MDGAEQLRMPAVQTFESNPATSFLVQRGVRSTQNIEPQRGNEYWDPFVEMRVVRQQKEWRDRAPRGDEDSFVHTPRAPPTYEKERHMVKRQVAGTPQLRADRHELLHRRIEDDAIHQLYVLEDHPMYRDTPLPPPKDFYAGPIRPLRSGHIQWTG